MSKKYQLPLFGSATKVFLSMHLAFGAIAFLCDPLASLIGGGEKVGVIFFGIFVLIYSLYSFAIYPFSFLMGGGAEIPFPILWLIFGTLQMYLVGLVCDFFEANLGRKPTKSFDQLPN